MTQRANHSLGLTGCYVLSLVLGHTGLPQKLKVKSEAVVVEYTIQDSVT